MAEHLKHVRHGFGSARPHVHGCSTLWDLVKDAFGAVEIERHEFGPMAECLRFSRKRLEAPAQSCRCCMGASDNARSRATSGMAASGTVSITTHRILLPPMAFPPRHVFPASRPAAADPQDGVMQASLRAAGRSTVLLASTRSYLPMVLVRRRNQRSGLFRDFAA